MADHSCTQCHNQQLNMRSMEADIRIQVRKLARFRDSPRAAAEVKAKIVELKERLAGNRSWLKQHLQEV